MSAYICSDKHFAVVAKYFYPGDLMRQQFFADQLKRENIKSVNHRYNERTRFRKVNLDDATAADLRLYNIHDALCLLKCIDYQSCEHPGRDDTLITLAMDLLRARGADSDRARHNLWSI